MGTLCGRGDGGGCAWWLLDAHPASVCLLGSPAPLPCVTLKGRQAFNCAAAYSTVTRSLLALPGPPACSACHRGLLRPLSRPVFFLAQLLDVAVG